MAAELRPDVILMDVRMPGMDGIEATRRIVAAGDRSRVLILTTFDLDEYAHEALRAGASGFLLKDAHPEELLAGIRAVASGDAVIAPALTRRLLDAYAQHLPKRSPAGPARRHPRRTTPASAPSPNASARSSSPSAGAGPTARSPSASSSPSPR
jgi:DNA-binding NarL/FixJ family response regulator